MSFSAYMNSRSERSTSQNDGAIETLEFRQGYWKKAKLQILLIRLRQATDDIIAMLADMTLDDRDSWRKALSRQCSDDHRLVADDRRPMQS